MKLRCPVLQIQKLLFRAYDAHWTNISGPGYKGKNYYTNQNRCSINTHESTALPDNLQTDYDNSEDLKKV
jgi:hypothetical protein